MEKDNSLVYLNYDIQTKQDTGFSYIACKTVNAAENFLLAFFISKL